MSQAIIMAQKGAVDRSFDLLEQFTDTCPDDIWAAKNGQWPPCQEVYHSAGAVKFFTGLNEGIETLAPDEIANLARAAEEPLPKARVKSVLKAARATVEKYIGGLTDADLAKRNEAVFAAKNWEITHGFTLVTLASHNCYHLGSCDTALRAHGLKGVF